MEGRINTKKLFAAILVVLIVGSLSISAFADTAMPEVPNVKISASDPIYASIKGELATIASLRQQIKTLTNDIKTVSQSNREILKSKAGLKNKLSVLLGLGIGKQIKALAPQIKAAQADVKTEITKIKADISSLKEAAKNKDYDAAEISLKSIIASMQQIITDLNTVLGLQQQVTTILSSIG